MQPCVYRDLADFAVRIDAATGKETQVDLWLCNWPSTMGPRPPWLDKLIGCGLAIDPDPDCVNCPVRKE